MALAERDEAIFVTQIVSMLPARGKMFMRTTVAIPGAGPAGVAAAVHVSDRNIEPLILEQGSQVAIAVREWGHVPMFSNRRFNFDAIAARRLERAGWQRPDPNTHPTGADLINGYRDPLGGSLAALLRLGQRVAAVSRDGIGKVRDAGRGAAPFVIDTVGPNGPETFRADAVMDATGTWDQRNPGGAGRPVPGEEGHPMVSHGMPDIRGDDRARLIGRRVGVLGGGHSAIGNLIALAALPGTRPIRLCRAQSAARALGGGAADQLSARGALGVEMAQLVAAGKVALQAGFRLAAIEGTGPVCAGATDGQCAEMDALIFSTGFRPDLSILGELCLSLDPALECSPALAPLIDPNLHSCGTVRPHGAAELSHAEPGFHTAGMKSCGRAPTFLLATGHEQVRSTMAASGCCCGQALDRVVACCIADEAAKDCGRAGCDCAASQPEQKAAACC